MQIPNITIAIDGYSSTGKSSFAKAIAKELLFLYIDSGAMYRCITLFAIKNNFIADNSQIDLENLKNSLGELKIHFENDGACSKAFINGECVEDEIRSLKIANYVSPISTIGFVRDFVNTQLRELSEGKGVVMDGRDIGTTVFPNAEIKIFMTATPLIRAERRALELTQKGEKVTLDEVLKNLSDRDRIDSSRKISPLTQAKDAIILDNSHMSLEDQLIWFKKLITEMFHSN